MQVMHLMSNAFVRFAVKSFILNNDKTKKVIYNLRNVRDKVDSKYL